MKIDGGAVPTCKILGVTNQIKSIISWVDNGCRQPDGHNAVYAAGDRNGKEWYRPGPGSGFDVTRFGGGGVTTVLIHTAGHDAVHTHFRCRSITAAGCRPLACHDIGSGGLAGHGYNQENGQQQ